MAVAANNVFRPPPGGNLPEYTADLYYPDISHRYLAVRSGVASMGLSGNLLTATEGAAVILGAAVTTARSGELLLPATLALAACLLVGLLAGMFGLGAGWANVPVLNLLMGAPLKVSVATSKFLLSITDTSAAWIYMNRGCVIPLIGVPSIVGLMLGSLIGVKILAVAKPKMIRYMVIAVLFFAGLKAIDKGLGLGFLG